MKISLEGKVTLITGAARGIGYEIANVFGTEGSKIAICDKDETSLLKALENLQDLGIDAAGMAIDVSDEEQFRNFADYAEKCFGGIDIWINNAGMYPQIKITEMSPSQWDEVFAVNVRSVFLGARLAKEKLSKKRDSREGGVILNAVSFAALMPSVASGAYAATKSAIFSMTKSLAAELAPLNIRVVGYIPGVIETDMTRPVIDRLKEKLYTQQALHRTGQVKDVAYPLLFLASDYASFITGTCLEVTGGKFCVQDAMQAWP